MPLTKAELVRAGARRIYASMMTMAYELPMSAAAVCNLAMRYSLALVPICDDPHAEAYLIIDARERGTIRYNASASEPLVMLYVWHEIAEYLAKSETPGLFDDWMPYRFDGTDWPASTHHLTAIATERLYIDALKAAGYPRVREMEKRHRDQVWRRGTPT